MTSKPTAGQGAKAQTVPKTESRFDTILTDMDSCFEQLVSIKSRLAEVNSRIFGPYPRNSQDAEVTEVTCYLDRRDHKQKDINEVFDLIRVEVSQLEEL